VYFRCKWLATIYHWRLFCTHFYLSSAMQCAINNGFFRTRRVSKLPQAFQNETNEQARSRSIYASYNTLESTRVRARQLCERIYKTSLLRSSPSSSFALRSLSHILHDEGPIYSLLRMPSEGGGGGPWYYLLMLQGFIFSYCCWRCNSALPPSFFYRWTHSRCCHLLMSRGRRGIKGAAAP